MARAAPPRHHAAAGASPSPRPAPSRPRRSSRRASGRRRPPARGRSPGSERRAAANDRDPEEAPERRRARGEGVRRLPRRPRPATGASGQSPVGDHAARSRSGARSVSAAGLKGRSDSEATASPCSPAMARNSQPAGISPRRSGGRAVSPGKPRGLADPTQTARLANRTPRPTISRCGPVAASTTPASATPTERGSTASSGDPAGSEASEQPVRRSPGQPRGHRHHSQGRGARAQRRRTGNSPRPPPEPAPRRRLQRRRHTPRRPACSLGHRAEQSRESDEDQGELDRGEVARQTTGAVPHPQRRQGEYQRTQARARQPLGPGYPATEPCCPPTPTNPS